MDVSPRFDVPANGRPHPAPTVGRTSVADASVCEWAVGLDFVSAARAVADSATALASAGFVDFDAIETVHLTSVAASGR